MMDVPVVVPALAVAAALCLAAALRLRATVTAFDLAGESLPLRAELTRFFNRLIVQHPWLERLLGPPDARELLDRAGRPWDLVPEKFDLIRGVAVGLAVVSVLAGVFASNLFAFLPVLLLKAPDWWLNFLAAERRKRMKREFIIVASRLATALGAGLGVTAALEWAAGGVAGPRSALRGELQRAVERARLNEPLEEILVDFATAVGLVDARRLATAVIQAQRYGAPVAGKLAEAVRDARERRKAEIVGQAKAAEQRMHLAVLVMALPTVICTLGPMLISLAQQNPFGP